MLICTEISVFEARNEDPLISDEKFLLEIGEKNREIKRVEDEYRRLFVSKREEEIFKLVHKKFGDDLLIDIYVTDMSWKSSVTVQLPMILSKNRGLIISRTPGHLSIVGQEEFIGNWKALTSDIFEGMDWSNIVVAGTWENI